MAARLITIPISHYCEKARWALDRAGIAYREERHVQLVHVLASRRAGGTGTTPVLVDGDRVLAESEDIVRWACPELFEGDGVEALCRWLDAGLGPDGRRWVYAQMAKDRDVLLRFNNQGVPRWEDALLRGGFRVLVPLVQRVLGVDGDTIARDGPRVRAAFDAIAQRLADGRPYLCGDRFTAADLTFASLSAAVLLPPQYGVPLPQPAELIPEVARAVEEFRAHPAGAFALRLYATERRRSNSGDCAV